MPNTKHAMGGVQLPQGVHCLVAHAGRQHSPVTNSQHARNAQQGHPLTPVLPQDPAAVVLCTAWPSSNYWVNNYGNLLEPRKVSDTTKVGWCRHQPAHVAHV